MHAARGFLGVLAGGGQVGETKRLHRRIEQAVAIPDLRRFSGTHYSFGRPRQTFFASLLRHAESAIELTMKKPLFWQTLAEFYF